MDPYRIPNTEQNVDFGALFTIESFPLKTEYFQDQDTSEGVSQCRHPLQGQLSNTPDQIEPNNTPIYSDELTAEVEDHASSSRPHNPITWMALGGCIVSVFILVIWWVIPLQRVILLANSAHPVSTA